MSTRDYGFAKSFALSNATSKSLIMAAMMQADEDTYNNLCATFPKIKDELFRHYERDPEVNGVLMETIERENNRPPEAINSMVQAYQEVLAEFQGT